LIGKEITEPILELNKAIEKVGTGDLNTFLPVDSADEIGKLREGFNKMVRGLNERDFIKETFGKFVSKQVSEAVLNGKLRLGGETREVSILLCDIRDFTSLSSQIEPEEIVDLLNSYFSEMLDVVFESEGILDKFIGDAFLVIYGAPLNMDSHAIRAAETAIKLREQLKKFNEKRIKKNEHPISIGISINTGKVVAGNIGTRNRMEYTVIGNTVNLTSRIEGLNRLFDTDILISDSTYELIKDKVEVTPMEPVRVKGNPDLVQAYYLEKIREI